MAVPPSPAAAAGAAKRSHIIRYIFLHLVFFEVFLFSPFSNMAHRPVSARSDAVPRLGSTSRDHCLLNPRSSSCLICWQSRGREGKKSGLAFMSKCVGHLGRAQVDAKKLEANRSLFFFPFFGALPPPSLPSLPIPPQKETCLLLSQVGPHTENNFYAPVFETKMLPMLAQIARRKPSSELVAPIKSIMLFPAIRWTHCFFRYREKERENRRNILSYFVVSQPEKVYGAKVPLSRTQVGPLPCLLLSNYKKETYRSTAVDAGKDEPVVSNKEKFLAVRRRRKVVPTIHHSDVLLGPPVIFDEFDFFWQVVFLNT